MLYRDTETVVLANGDELEIQQNPIGTNGWMVPVYIGYDEHDNSLAWECDGTSLDGQNYNIVEVR